MTIEKIKKLIEFIIKLFRPKKENPDIAPPDSDIDVLPDKNDVKNLLLVFEVGLSYLFNHPDTIKIREIIKDEFGGGKNNWDLQCTEYVQYKIQQMGITIKWPVKYNRNGGMWATIFEKHGPYKVLDTPRQYCAICFPPNERNPFGHIAFVEKVNDDESIYISEANWPKEGIYNKRPLKKSQWKDLFKTRFIDFSDNSVVIKEESLALGATCDLKDNTIFFTYSNKDKILASKIKLELKKYNFDVFLAYEDLDLSDDWSKKIKNKIKCCRFFLSLRTGNFYKNTFAIQEEGMAIALDKKIIPLFVNVSPKDCGYLYEYHGLIFNDQEIERDCRRLTEGILKLEKK
jgi:hypothetical protein